MENLLQVTDRRDQGKRRFDQHALIPRSPRTLFEVGRDTLCTSETDIGQDDAAANERRWAERDCTPEREATRLLACYLHIGLEHLAYNAQIGDWAAVLDVAERMRALVPESLG